MDEIREGKKDLVIGIPLPQFFLDDFKVAQPGHPRTGNDHSLGPAVDERHDAFFKNTQHHLGLVLNQAVIFKSHVLKGLGHHADRIELFFIRLGHHRAMQMVKGLVGDDACRDIHDVPLGNGLGLAVNVEGLAEERYRGRRRGGGKGDKKLVAVISVDDFDDLFFLILFRKVSIGGFGIAERHPNGDPHLAFLGAVRFVDQKRHAEFFQSFVFPDLLQYPLKFLLGSDDDGPSLL